MMVDLFPPYTISETKARAEERLRREAEREYELRVKEGRTPKLGREKFVLERIEEKFLIEGL